MDWYSKVMASEEGEEPRCDVSGEVHFTLQPISFPRLCEQIWLPGRTLLELFSRIQKRMFTFQSTGFQLCQKQSRLSYDKSSQRRSRSWIPLFPEAAVRQSQRPSCFTSPTRSWNLQSRRSLPCLAQNVSNTTNVRNITVNSESICANLIWMTHIPGSHFA